MPPGDYQIRVEKADHISYASAPITVVDELVRLNSHYNHHRLIPAKHQQGPEKDIIQLRLAVSLFFSFLKEKRDVLQ